MSDAPTELARMLLAELAGAGGRGSNVDTALRIVDKYFRAVRESQIRLIEAGGDVHKAAAAIMDEAEASKRNMN